VDFRADARNPGQLDSFDLVRFGGWDGMNSATNLDVVVNERFGSELERLAQDERARSLLEALPVAVYLTDAAGRIIYFNEAAAELWGHRPDLGTSSWCGSWRLYWPDGRPMAHDECPMAMALKERRQVRGAEAVAERPDGTRVPFLAFPTPLFDAERNLVGGVNMLLDITERKGADQASQILAALVESSQDAIVSKDLNGIIQTWNLGAERLFGYLAEEVVGKPVVILIPADHADEEPEILRRIRRGERIETYETVRQRKDGSLVDVSLTVSPVKDQSGRIVGASKIARDITERKRAEEQQKLLVREIKHRIKNTLATVQAIARQTLSGATREELEAFTGRLQALAGAHDLLTSEHWNRAPLGDVVARAINAFDDVARERFVVDGRSDVWIDAERSSGLSMVLHELATNAIKYGALSNDTGKVEIDWETRQEGDRLLLTFRWREVGGPPVKAPERRGFGSSLIQRALENESTSIGLDFDPAGLRFTLKLSL
jgi:PAS domain S-box-containing protein